MTDEPRRYTVAEIGDMRRAILKEIWEYAGNDYEAKHARAEDMLRTYIFAGSPPEEVISAHIAAAEKFKAESIARQKRFEEGMSSTFSNRHISNSHT